MAAIVGDIVGDIVGPITEGIIQEGGGLVTTTFDFSTSIPSPFTFTRSGTALYEDYGGRVITAAANQAGHVGTRVAENLLSKPLDLSHGDWDNSNVTVGTGVSDPDGGTTAFTLTATAASAYLRETVFATGDQARNSIWIRRRTGSGTIQMYTGDGTNSSSITITSSWQRIAADATSVTSAGEFGIVINTSGDAVDVWQPMGQNCIAQENKNPNHEFIEGVKHYDTLNATTVNTSGVVTGRNGAKIDQRKNADGSDDHVTFAEWTSDTNAEIHVTIKTTSTSAVYITDNDDAANRCFWIINPGSGSTKPSGSTMWVDGVSGVTVVPNDGKEHKLKLVVPSGLKVARLFSRYTGIQDFSGCICDVLLLRTDGTDERHYKLDELTGTVATDSISGQDGTYVNMTSPLPLLTKVIKGVLKEPSATNDAIRCRDMTNAAWTATNVTATQVTSGAIDGGGFSRLTASAANGTIFQSVTSSSTARCYSADIRRNNGTGTIEMTLDGGSTYTDITSQISTSTFTRIDITQTLANPSIGFRIVTSGDAIDVDFNGLEDGVYPSSRIETVASTVTRNATLLTGPFTHSVNDISYELEMYPIPGSTEDRVFDTYVVSGQASTTSNKLEAELGMVTGVLIGGKATGGGPIETNTSIFTFNRGDQLDVIVSSGSGNEASINSGIFISGSVNSATAVTSNKAGATLNYASKMTDITIGSRKDGTLVCPATFKELQVVVNQ